MNQTQLTQYEGVTAIVAGNFVRSYDFEGRTDCFIEGYVRGFEEQEGCERYVIEVERVVFGGATLRAQHRGYIYPPVNGTPKLFGGVCNGVERLAVNDETRDGGRPVGLRRAD